MNQLLPVNDQAPTARTRGMRTAVLIVYVLFTISCLCAISALLSHWHGIAFSRLVGGVLATFGIFKLVLAWDAVVAPLAQAPQTSQRQESGTPIMFRLWVSYKLWAGLLALAAGVALMVLRSSLLDRMPYMTMG